MAESSKLSSFVPLFSSSIRQISSNPLQAALLVDVSCAFLAHAWFRKFEPDDVRGGLIRLTFFAIAPIAMAVINLPSTQPWLNGLLHFSLFASVLLFSILLYRVSPFHPMAKYPGPLVCKLSKLWMAWLFHKGKVHVYLKELHDKYGPIVRIGPNELSVVEVDLLPSILGQQGMPKGPMWEGRQPNYIKNRKTGGSIVSLRDANLHAKYRKPWTRAFGPGPLQDYEESLMTRANEMVEHLKENCKNSQGEIGNVDMARYITLFSFDLMGDIVFGEGFSLMRDGDENGYLDGIQRAIRSTAVLMTIPWVTDFTRFTQLFASKSTNGQFSTLALQLAQRRIKKVSEKRDLFYHLSANMDVPNEKLVTSNASFAVLAGLDTTSSVLCGTLFYLLRYPDYMQHVRKELDEAFASSADIQCDKLINLEWLNAVINEVMRLQPPLLTYMQRAPAENSGGRRLGDMFIPERGAVVVPPYVLHRDPRYFSPNPNQFWPERWLSGTNEKLTLNRSAFIPFSMGPASCAGKPLAWSQLRYITALLVYNFDFLFSKEYNPSQWEEDLLDKMMIIKGSLPVQMKIRVRS